MNSENMTIGFIGCGNMASAMVGGLISSNTINPNQIYASRTNESQLNEIKEKYKINVSTDNCEVAFKSDVIILGVKPYMYKDICIEINKVVDNRKIIVGICPGQSLADINSYFDDDMKIVRGTPNTPALVNEGMSCLCPNDLVTDEEFAFIFKIFESFGKCERITENLIDAVIAVSGSAPAYVYMFIEALADGAVRGGLKRDMAYALASQTVLGSAKMVIDTKMHPGELKDMVCSPGGTTIEAVAMLEKYGMKNAVLEAMDACIKKCKYMSQPK